MTTQILSDYDVRRLRAIIDGGVPITLQDVLDAHDTQPEKPVQNIFDRIEDRARRRIKREEQEAKDFYQSMLAGLARIRGGAAY